jgi:hypothetical protein
MRPQTIWRDDAVCIEIGVRNADLALALRQEGYSKYLGVSGDLQRVSQLQAKHPELAAQLTCSHRPKLVAGNNAEVLILSGRSMLHLWRYRSVRHSQWVAWRCGLSLLSLIALLGCFCYSLFKRYGRPQIVTLRLSDGRTRRMFVSRVLRHKGCRQRSRHFIPHGPGLAGLFQQFDRHAVRYAVLRWFDTLPEIDPNEDVDLLVDDRSLDNVLKILYSQPGIQPCDVYSESGLAGSAYCGTPYYPPKVARWILDGAVRHNGLCKVPNAWDYFHSLAYHAVYHKGASSHLEAGNSLPKAKGTPEHDYAGILRNMSEQLEIRSQISLEGLHAHLQRNGWGPSPEMLVRLAGACPSNGWLTTLAGRQEPHLHNQGLTVFVIRREAVRRSLAEQIIGEIEKSGFEILATSELLPEEVEQAAARSRGGNWEAGEPYQRPGGPPAIAVIAYDRQPLPPSRRQRRKFPQRTNARIFVKESIRDAIVAELPENERFNALHSSDNAAEAWHLIEVLAPRLMEEIQARLRRNHGTTAADRQVGRAA